MNKNISKLLIFLITAILCAGKCFADTEAEQPVLLTVQPAVIITKTSTAATETGKIDTENAGMIITPLSSQFSIQTNETDDTCDFVLTSKIQSAGGMVSGYSNNGSNVYLLFSNIENIPTEEAVANAKIGGSNNDNVIAYPVSVSITQPMSVNYSASNAQYGDCYLVKVNGETEGTLTHQVSGSPVGSTYNLTRDTSGTYQAIVTFTAVAK